MMQLTKKDVTVLALWKLGGSSRVVDTEDAAIAAHSIDADAFGWKKYPDRVDLDAVRTSLRHEGEGKSPRIEGSIQAGWHMTPVGVAWIEANSELVGAEITVAATSPATQRWRAETRESGAASHRVRTSDAFRLWAKGEKFSARQAAGVFRIDQYTPVKERTRKAAQMQESVRGDSELDAFIREAIPIALALQAPRRRQEAGDE
ncbi:hypothetical protein [Leifsonia poae]|uniref:hypothetical protein n=1 Tax=Leifsonia poae TaxID=110933 RepID=UPI003D673A81